MRTFIAIDFSAQLKSRIAQLQRDLRKNAVSGRWKYIDNFHLTLKFLDEIDASTAASLEGELKSLSSSVRSFKLNISGLGSFPGNNCLRVVWLGLSGELDRLRSLQSAIDNRLGGYGFPPEKRAYTPHITIGQDVVFSQDVEKLKRLVDFSSFSEIAVDKIYLYKSEQIANKRVYTPLNEFIFGGNRPQK